MSISDQIHNASQYPGETLYTDANGLSGLKKQAREEQDKALPEVARQFESIFIGMVMKSMRQVSLGDDLLGSSAVDTFRDMHDQQMSIELAKNKGFGLAESIVRQLKQDHSATKEPDINPDGSLTLPIRQNFYQDYAKIKERQSEQQDKPLQNNNGKELPVSVLTDQNVNKKVLNIEYADTVKKLDSVADNKQIKEITIPLSFSNPKEFVDKLWPMAEKAAETLGVKPEVLLSQAALETGWGQSIIKNSDTNSYNLFNIKADSRWDGEKITKLSLEYENDKPVNKNSYFRVYDTLQDSFDDYVQFIKNNPRYEKALQNMDDPEQYLHGIHKAGYATDPEYTDKIMKVMNSNNIQGKLSNRT
jgi:peptidoglycan hydrolase FlgJ